MSNDKAGKELWNKYWVSSEIPVAIAPRHPGFKNYLNRRFHEYFCQAFSGMETQGLKLLELGCARSVWLPYFANEFGFKVYGIDYSEIGCQQAKAILSNAGVDQNIICSDFFTPPESLLNTFDVVVSFGVVEHFEDTAGCLYAFSKFLKHNGIMITNIPNMNGLNSLIFKLVNRPVYDTHFLLDVGELVKAHELAGFEVLSCDYFLSTHFGVPNLVGLNPQRISTRLKGFFLSTLSRIGKVVWAIEDRLMPFKPTKFLSPYIMLTGKKK